MLRQETAYHNYAVFLLHEFLTHVKTGGSEIHLSKVNNGIYHSPYRNLQSIYLRKIV
jgi:hypothetical protein